MLSPSGIRPVLGNLNYPKLKVVESNALVAPFTEEEIRKAVWNCDNNKSQGSDGVSFTFIKQFWSTVKSNFISF